jgi:lipocalin-like protein
VPSPPAYVWLWHTGEVAATLGNCPKLRVTGKHLRSLSFTGFDPLRTTGVPRSVALIDISIWGVFMDRRCILGLFATALILVPAIPDIAIAQGKSLKDQLVGTWIYVSSTGKRDDGSAVDRPPAQGALTYTADGRFHFITVRTTVPKYASNDPSRPSPEEAMAVASGVVAYTGTYTLDESAKTAHLNIETSSVPNLVGAPNQRRIVTSITDEELKITNPRTPAGVTLELVFKRAK